MGSAAIGGLIAHAAFWILLVRGYVSDEIGVRGCAIALVLCDRALRPLTRALRPAVQHLHRHRRHRARFRVFKGDVRLT